MILPLLSLLIFLPLIGIGFVALVRQEEARNVRAVGLWISFITFLLSLVVSAQFDPYNTEYQFVERYLWIESYNIFYALGVDSIALTFILLTTFLTPLCLLISWNSIQHRVREFTMAFLLLEALLIGLFSSTDLFLFYIFFESVLIPLFLIIGLWGGERRIYACFKFFLYTFLGSVFMLLALVKLYSEFGLTDIGAFKDITLHASLQKWVFVAFILSFAIKVPFWPVHTWLPDAHVEAPTAGSVLLAGVLLKMGGYGIVRLVLPLLPEACYFFAPFMQALGGIALIAMSLVALVQTDIKKLIAYSSVAHMGYVTIGLFCLNGYGVTGALIQMLSHGLISAALFLCIGMLYERYHTRLISAYGGLMTQMPIFAAFFLFFNLAAIGLPGTSGFIGEFYVLISTFPKHFELGALVASGVVLSASYSLWMYKRLCFGKPSVLYAEHKNAKDLDKRECMILTLLAVTILFLGIYPKPVSDPLNRQVRVLLEHYK